MRFRALAILAALFVFLGGCRSVEEPASSPQNNLQARAQQIAHDNIIVDTHIDVPYRLRQYHEDVTEQTELGDFDYVRAKDSGLNAAFMSIYIPVEYQERGGAKALADSLIDMVEGFAERAPDKFALATSPEDVHRHFEEDLISLPMGMENGAGLEGDLDNLQHFYDRGIRYITLAHAEPNRISDSSYDTTRIHGGLSAFGEEVVRQMNRLGMMVDVSHITDSAFYDVMQVTEAPVVATHSSARHFTPGWERNMSDALIERLAKNDGVMMVAFGSAFLRNEYQDDDDPVRAQIEQYREKHDLDEDSPKAYRYYQQQRKAHPIGDVDDVADHIDHVVELVGVDHVGLGSDFDGVFALPAGLQDASDYPNLVRELLERGYSERDIQKILGGNLLRVWSEVEAVSRRMQGEE